MGNRFETLFLPSAIIIVEGKSDEIFIRRVVELEFPNATVSIISAGDDSRVKEAIYMAGSFFSDIQKSPYRDRIFPIIDSVHKVGLIQQIENMGIPRENIIDWSMNGIEYYYPSRIVDAVFGAGPAVTVTSDSISRNGVTYKKAELSQRVVSALRAQEVYSAEFREKFINKIAAVVKTD